MISLQLFVLLPSKCSRIFLFYVGVLGTSDVKFLTPHSNIDKVINEPWRILFMNNNERKTERRIKSTQSEIPETNCLPSTVMTLCIRYLHLPHLFTLNLIWRNLVDFHGLLFNSRPLLAMRKNVPFQTIDCRKHLQSMFQIHSLYLALTY